jgi:virginiamycin B lyase
MLTGLSIFMLLAALGVGTAGAMAHEPTVTEFETGRTLNSGPWGITEGPGGKLWFTENNADALGSITPDAGLIAELTSLPIAGEVRGITEGPDGNLWVTEVAPPGRIARITPAGVVAEWNAYPGPSYPVDITAGPDGNLWFVSQSPEFVGRITPSGTITHFTVGLTPNSDLSSITTGPDGALWFTEKADPGRIGRITTEGVITEYSAGLTPNMAPTDITAGPDGKLWFTENNNPGGIGRISTGGTITEFSDGLTAGARPVGIAAGSDEALWFTESSSPGAIGRITTDGTITEHSAGLSPGRSPWQIAAGPDGNMWFTGNANPGMIGQITVPPGVKGRNAQFVDTTAADLRAKIRPNSQDTYYYFEYGTTTGFGKTTPEQYAGNGSKALEFTQVVTDLEPATTYYFRAVATNDAGTTLSETRSLKTRAKSVPVGSPRTEPTPDPDVTNTADKIAEFAKSVVAGPQAGSVRYKPPGGRWRPLTNSGAEIVVGGTLDTRRGSAKLTSVGRGGVTQTGTFGAGVFSVHQARDARGRVDLRLRGGDFSRCRRRGDVSPSRMAAAAAVRRVRRLWGRDGGGRFRTYGRHSHATVRGTRWLTEDRCRGTFTRVTHGAVVVRDTVRDRSVLVRAGHHYLAKRPRR